MEGKTYTHGYGYGKWTDILDKYVTAPEEGLYLLSGISCNQETFNLFSQKKHDNIVATTLNKIYNKNMLVDDISDDFKDEYEEAPLSFHFIPNYSPNSKFWKPANEPADNLHGIFVTAFKDKESIGYCYDFQPGLSIYPNQYLNRTTSFKIIQRHTEGYTHESVIVENKQRDITEISDEDMQNGIFVWSDEENCYYKKYPNSIEVIAYHCCWLR